jgi:MFS family permease
MISQLFSQLYYVPLYFESVQGKPPTEAGTGLFPATFTFIPVGIIVGRLITRTGRYREFVWSGWAITTLVCGLLILFDTNTNTATWASILILLGIGHGLVLTSLTFATQAIAEDGDAAFAATMYAFTRTLGMTLGVSIGGTIFVNKMRQKLQMSGLPIEIARNAEGYLATLRALPPSSVLKQGVREAYVEGYHGVFEVMTGISAAALLLSLLIKPYSLDKELDSQHKLREAEGSIPEVEDGRRATSEDAAK